MYFSRREIEIERVRACMVERNRTAEDDGKCFVGLSTEWMNAVYVCVCVCGGSLEHIKCEWKQKSGCMKHIYVAKNKQATENSNPNSISNSFCTNEKHRMWGGAREKISTSNYCTLYCYFSRLKESLLWSLFTISANRPSATLLYKEMNNNVLWFLPNLKLPRLFFFVLVRHNFQVTRNQIFNTFERVMFLMLN